MKFNFTFSQRIKMRSAIRTERIYPKISGVNSWYFQVYLVSTLGILEGGSMLSAVAGATLSAD
jgi:hypothetical protein